MAQCRGWQLDPAFVGTDVKSPHCHHFGLGIVAGGCAHASSCPPCDILLRTECNSKSTEGCICHGISLVLTASTRVAASLRPPSGTLSRLACDPNSAEVLLGPMEAPRKWVWSSYAVIVSADAIAQGSIRASLCLTCGTLLAWRCGSRSTDVFSCRPSMAGLPPHWPLAACSNASKR